MLQRDTALGNWDRETRRLNIATIRIYVCLIQKTKKEAKDSNMRLQNEGRSHHLVIEARG